VRATRLGTLSVLAVLGALFGFLLVATAYGRLPPLPRSAPVPMALIGMFELGLARLVRDRVHRADRPARRPGPRPLHPLQVARAVALAKASSPTAALLLGGYVGLGLALLPREADQARADLLTCAVSGLAALLLLVAALLLERACRTPDRSDDEPGLGSRA